MGKHDQESAAVGARRATGAATGRGRGGRFRPGASARRCGVCCAGRISSRCRGHWGSRRRGPRAGVTEFLAAGQAGLKSRAPDCPGRRPPSAAGQDRRAADGDRVAVREGGPTGGRLPFGPAEVDAMSGAQSISTRRAYGVQRICRVWERARSSVYARRHATKSRALRCRREAASSRQPPRGASHFKPRTAKPGRSCGSAGIRTSKERVRRVMREHDLQAPHRVGHAHGPKAHDGTITTEAPDAMWGTDMTATVTLGEGSAFVFVAVDHCTTECSGLHAAKSGSRFEALEPIRQGVQRTRRRHWSRRGPWAASPSRPRVELSGRRFSTGGRVLRHRKLPELRAGARRQRRR